MRQIHVCMIRENNDQPATVGKCISEAVDAVIDNVTHWTVTGENVDRFELWLQHPDHYQFVAIPAIPTHAPRDIRPRETPSDEMAMTLAEWATYNVGSAIKFIVASQNTLISKAAVKEDLANAITHLNRELARLEKP